MNLVQNTLTSLLPPKRKLTPSGWTSFNSICCHHRGEKPDTRKRGGILFNSEGGFQYHCFNCNFKAGWKPGHNLSKNTKQLFVWLGLNDSDLNKLVLFCLTVKDDQPSTDRILSFDLVEKQLPDMTLSLEEWLSTDLTEDIQNNLALIYQYLEQRGMKLDWYPWHYSHSPGYRDRVIIPFYHRGKIVGYTGRKIVDGKPKYLTDAQPNYVFNLDNQHNNKMYVIVTEGQFDAIAIDGVAIMSNEPNKEQITRINNLNKTVIVVPDRDKPGAKLLYTAIEQNWSVSLPPWDPSVKDVADAVKLYGRLYTLSTILHYKTDNKIKIELLKKKLLNHNE